MMHSFGYHLIQEFRNFTLKDNDYDCPQALKLQLDCDLESAFGVGH